MSQLGLQHILYLYGAYSANLSMSQETERQLDYLSYMTQDGISPMWSAVQRMAQIWDWKSIFGQTLQGISWDSKRAVGSRIKQIVMNRYQMQWEEVLPYVHCIGQNASVYGKISPAWSEQLVPIKRWIMVEQVLNRVNPADGMYGILHQAKLSQTIKKVQVGMLVVDHQELRSQVVPYIPRLNYRNDLADGQFTMVNDDDMAVEMPVVKFNTHDAAIQLNLMQEIAPEMQFKIGTVVASSDD